MAYATLVAVSGLLALAAPSSLSAGRGRGASHPLAPNASHHGGASRDLPASRRIEVGTGVWLALALVCVLQAVPLPLAWLELLAPSQADVWARALRPFGVPAPELGTLSLAPHRSLVEALKMASYGVIFYLSARLGRHGMSRIAALAFGSALAVAVVAALHRAVGAEQLFGLYAPSDTATVAPLLNPNNRAGYYNLGFFCGLGLLFRVGASPRGAFIGIGLVLLVAEILLCQSRGGTVCLLLGMLAVPLLRPSRAGPPSEPTRPELSRSWQAAIVGVIAAGAASMAIVSRPKGGLGFEESLEKLQLFARAAQLVSDHFLTGVGRGAFGSAFSRYQPGAGAMVYEHAENLLLQWAAEWGVPVAVLALGAIVWSLRPVLARRSLSSPVRRCALIGAGALVAQNLVDLGLEITAIAALTVYVLGGLLGAALSSAAPAREPSRRLLALGCLSTALLIALVLAEGRGSPARERERMHARLGQARGAPAASDWQALRAAVLEYPADPYFPLLGAAAALAARSDALPWAARAIELSPGSAPARLALARALLARQAPAQASDALRAAIELDPGTAHAAIRIGLDGQLSTELLARAVPEGPAGSVPLQALADYSPPGSSERVRWLEQALAHDPGSAVVHYRIALELQRDAALGERGVICRERRDECVRRALAHVERAEPSPQTVLLHAQLVELSQGPRPAEDQLAADCARFPGDEDCARALVALALRNQSERVPSAVRAWIASGCATRERCGATHFGVGQQFAALGQWRNAQSHYRQATQEWPTADAWRALAHASTELGQSGRAEDALRRAALLEAAKKGAQ